MPPAETDETRKQDWLGLGGGSDDENAAASGSEEEEESRVKGVSQHRSTKRRRIDRSESAADSGTDEDEDGGGVDLEQGVEDEEEGGSQSDGTAGKETKKEKNKKPAKAADEDELITSHDRIKPLSKEELAASKAATAKTGVVYLSRIPPFMKPMKVKDLLSKFGEIGRVFLAPEDPKAYARRVRFGGNKKKNFEEGWVEFKSKKDAKLAAETLNTQIIGGKKGSYYHDDVWNIKYLPKFKWHHLQAQISLENAQRQAKMRAEIAHETRVNKTYLRNVERAKMIESMEAKKRKRKQEVGGSQAAADEAEAPPEKQRRQFRQIKPVAKGQAKQGGEGEGAKPQSEKVKNLLSQVF